MSTLKQIRDLVKSNENDKAQLLLITLIKELFNLKIDKVQFNSDGYSLNSLNGFLLDEQNRKQYFFKFHQEEDEEDILEEYYNIELLKEVNLPITEPAFVSKEVGKQILIYPFSQSPRYADICLELERNKNKDSFDFLTRAQRDLDKKVLSVYAKSLHVSPSENYKHSSLLKLFYWRLVNSTENSELGGRIKLFYLDKDVYIHDRKISFNELWKKKWIINGIPYKETLEEVIEKSRQLLAPDAISSYPAVVSHGDAHNANLWFHEKSNSLSYFDPAFAGKHIHALLAEIKPTFHNIFAHPFWLYHPEDSKVNIDITWDESHIIVNHDWQLTDLREEFLHSKTYHFWKPWLQTLQNRSLLPGNWENFMRSALFCCPFLVINLLDNKRFPESVSLLGLSISMMLGSKPSSNHNDLISRFFTNITP